VRDLSAAVPVQAPSGFAIAFLNTYVREFNQAGGNPAMPLRYVVSQLAGLTLEHDVTIRVEYVPQPGDAPADLYVCWDPDAGLYPSFRGALHAEPAGEKACTLSITGNYDVPGGVAGQLFDAVIGVRIAHGTLEQLLEQFRTAIEEDYKKRMEYA
jgi:hypothetical protein